MSPDFFWKDHTVAQETENDMIGCRETKCRQDKVVVESTFAKESASRFMRK